MTTTQTISFFVPGIPVPGGSKSAFAYRCKKTGKLRASVTDSAGQKNKDWRATVSLAAHEAMAGRSPFTGPLTLDVEFVMPRAKGHFGTGKNEGVLKGTAPRHHTKKPDRTKLLRAFEDALPGAVVVDDTQFVDGQIKKRYATPGEPTGAHCTIRTKGTQQ